MEKPIRKEPFGCGCGKKGEVRGVCIGERCEFEGTK